MTRREVVWYHESGDEVIVMSSTIRADTIHNNYRFWFIITLGTIMRWMCRAAEAQNRSQFQFLDRSVLFSSLSYNTSFMVSNFPIIGYHFFFVSFWHENWSHSAFPSVTFFSTRQLKYKNCCLSTWALNSHVSVLGRFLKTKPLLSQKITLLAENIRTALRPKLFEAEVFGHFVNQNVSSRRRISWRKKRKEQKKKNHAYSFDAQMSTRCGGRDRLYYTSGSHWVRSSSLQL